MRTKCPDNVYQLFESYIGSLYSMQYMNKNGVPIQVIHVDVHSKYIPHTISPEKLAVVIFGETVFIKSWFDGTQLFDMILIYFLDSTLAVLKTTAKPPTYIPHHCSSYTVYSHTYTLSTLYP